MRKTVRAAASSERFRERCDTLCSERGPFRVHEELHLTAASHYMRYGGDLTSKKGWDVPLL